MTGIMKSKFLTSAGLLALFCALLSPGAWADGAGLGDLTITFPTISGSAGDTIVVSGILKNNSSNTLDFANDSVTFNNHSALGGVGDAAFNAFLGLGPSSIGGNSTLTGVDLFTVFIATDAAPGLYDVNFYDLLGGTDANCSADFTLCGVQLGTIEFTVNVQGAVVTPEPGTLMLLVSGLVVGILVLCRTAH
jgi:hypothetical protein